MPPNKSSSYFKPPSKAPTKRASTSSSRAGPASKKRATTSAVSDDDDDRHRQQFEDDEEEQQDVAEEEEDEADKPQTIPPALLTRLLHEFFTKDGTRITKDANDAVAKYMDVFVREAIARSCAEKRGDSFLEVENLEKVAPQLLLDL